MNASVERWHRVHANGWRAEAIRDEHGHWRAAAHPEDGGGTYSRVNDLATARHTADSRVPQHGCSSASCGCWLLTSA